MYQVVSSLSLIVRSWICYITIETLPIFANEAIEWVFGQIISIYVIFRLICYPIVGVLSRRMRIESSTAKSIIYSILYILLAGICWAILLILTHVTGALPI